MIEFIGYFILLSARAIDGGKNPKLDNARNDLSNWLWDKYGASALTKYLDTYIGKK